MNLTSKALYFRDISRYKVLSDAEERKLIELVQRNEPGAEDALIRANLRFVVSVAKAYRDRGVGFMDLINEGNIGLIKAGKRFNLAMNVKFISYAVWWIRQSIQKCLFEQAGVIRLPINKVALLRSFKQALDRNSGDYYATMMMEDFQPHESEIVEVMSKMRSVSLEAPLNNSPRGSDEGGDTTKTLQDILGNEPNQENDSELQELGAAIDSVFRDISNREERILRMYFGLNSPKHYTLEEIALELNLPRRRVRMLRDKALRHLMRNPVSRSRLSPFLETA
jgi:RNA polymerase primary sigma factor